jgi:hypothetical protein
MLDRSRLIFRRWNFGFPAAIGLHGRAIHRLHTYSLPAAQFIGHQLTGLTRRSLAGVHPSRTRLFSMNCPVFWTET